MITIPENVATKAAAARLMQQLNRVIEKRRDAILATHYFAVRNRHGIDFGSADHATVRELYYDHIAAHTLNASRRRAKAVADPLFKPFADAILALVDEAEPVAQRLTELKKAVAAAPKPQRDPNGPPSAIRANKYAMGTYTTLRATIEPQRAGYTAVIFKHLRDRVDAVLKRLADAGGDANAAAPYPDSRMGRTEHAMAVELYHEIRKWTVAVNTASRGPRDPEPRVAKPAAEIDRNLQIEANAITDADFSSYAAKLTGKILKDYDHDAKAIVTKATVNGQLWVESDLVVEVESGDAGSTDVRHQTWQTKMILNRSIYNRLFNQWPTRRVS